MGVKNEVWIRTSSFWRKYVSLLLLAGLGTFLVILLFLLRPFTLDTIFDDAGRVFYPVSPVGSAGYFDTFYQRVREYVDGRWLIADINLFEYRSSPLSARAPFPALFFSLFGRIGDLGWGMVWAQAVSVGVIYFLLTFFFSAITKRRLLGAVWSLVVITGPVNQLFDVFPQSIHSWMMLGRGGGILPTTITSRIFDYMMVESGVPSLIIYIAFLTCYWFYCQQMTSRRALLAGGAFGCLFYTYPTFWMIAALAFIIHVGYIILRRRWGALKTALGAFCFGLLIGAPVLMIRIRYAFQDGYLDIFDRTLLVFVGRVVLVERWLETLLLVAGFSLLVLIRRRPGLPAGALIFFGSLFVAGIVGSQLNLFFGTSFVPYGWIVRAAYLPWAALLCLLLARLASALEGGVGQYAHRLGVACAVGCMVLVVGATARQQMSISVEDFASHQLPAPIMEGLAWLDTQMETDAVVVSPSLFVNELIPFFTRGKVYVPHAWNTTAPLQEITDRFFTVMEMVRMPDEQIMRFFSQSATYMPYYLLSSRMFVYGDDAVTYLLGYGQRRWSQPPDAWWKPLEVRVSERAMGEVGERLTAFHLQPSHLRPRYRMDYLFLTAFDIRFGVELPSADAPWRLVYEKRGVWIYQYLPEDRTEEILTTP